MSDWLSEPTPGHSLEQERHQRQVVFLGQAGVDLPEPARIAEAQVRRRPHAEQHDRRRSGTACAASSMMNWMLARSESGSRPRSPSFAPVSITSTDDRLSQEPVDPPPGAGGRLAAHPRVHRLERKPGGVDLALDQPRDRPAPDPGPALRSDWFPGTRSVLGRPPPAAPAPRRPRAPSSAPHPASASATSSTPPSVPGYHSDHAPMAPH